MRARFRNLTHAAAFGVEWSRHGRRYRLWNPFFTTALILTVRVDQEHCWTTEPVNDPAAYGLTVPLTTFDQFRAVAATYRCRLAACTRAHAPGARSH